MTMSGLSTLSLIPPSDAEKITELKARLQIISNGFSVDYRNKIQILFIAIVGRYRGGQIYLLPSYEDYLQEKITQLEPYFLGIDLKEIYTSSISTGEIERFDERVESINTMVQNKNTEPEIRSATESFMRDFLSPPVDTVKDDTLKGFGKIF